MRNTIINFLRVSQPSEIETVARLAKEIWEAHYTTVIGHAQVVYMLEKFQSVVAISGQISEGYEYYITEHEGRHGGYFSIILNPAELSMQLSKIYVLPKVQGKGIGKTIVEFIVKRCVDLGAKELWLTVNRNNTNSIAFYEKMGFRKSDDIVIEIGDGFVMDDYRMAKKITKNIKETDHDQ